MRGRSVGEWEILDRVIPREPGCDEPIAATAQRLPRGWRSAGRRDRRKAVKRLVPHDAVDVRRQDRRRACGTRMSKWKNIFACAAVRGDPKRRPSRR